ncbi:MAG: hypothetical protein A2927_02000 [Candidatus Komeilibacteria bacterium RIFCSPLOWO2_01_FULL_45_10]|uniref:Uncharacterized protein n=1 Tax=Candidatus Komeilibacteria bacterium RIFCSPLOWO2_01_FULL_45_10 TaxID=1798550 RepID=A0A1G2BI88_9BACT|nr:MAG: hypothetical protein A2927_02000 [Candidatus Komeilibacteria bacterium RIFCSPLOWO2_01_FULL_45_10]
MKFLKTLGLKSIYLILFSGLLIFLLTVFLDIFKKYYESYRLSDQVNSYLQNVALEKVNDQGAKEAIEFLTPTTTSSTIESGALRNPFQPIAKEEEEAAAETE